MPSGAETTNLALFCDFENIALGVRDARYEKFDITRVLERLLLKGSIVVKKAYCDWERYKEFKAAMHHAGFELIEIPHVKVSGKNSADIRMVVDALDLCYTKPHVDTFVIISGDSDFSPLVSKLRENNKGVIGCGVKNSTSDLLIANCDEFIFYDDLVREQQQQKPRRAPRKKPPANQAAAAQSAPGQSTPGQAAAGQSPAGGGHGPTHPAVAEPRDEEPREEMKDEDRRQEAFDLVLSTIDALVSTRDADDKIWGSMVKQALKRRRPGFNESYYGFRSFNKLLEDAAARKLLSLERDDKSGGYLIHTNGEGP
jgi:uncharacterized protein (TIGR00288 family)